MKRGTYLVFAGQFSRLVAFAFFLRINMKGWVYIIVKWSVKFCRFIWFFDLIYKCKSISLEVFHSTLYHLSQVKVKIRNHTENAIPKNASIISFKCMYMYGWMDGRMDRQINRQIQTDRQRLANNEDTTSTFNGFVLTSLAAFFVLLLMMFISKM